MKHLAIFAKEPVLLPMLVLLVVIWLVPHTSLPGHVKERINEKYQQLPKVKVDFHPSATYRNRYSNNKTALYIETSDDVRHVTPLLLHMTQVVPPEWRFLFVGSTEQLSRINSSTPAREMVGLGKLRLQNVDRFVDQMETKDVTRRELRNRLLTNNSFYDDMLPGVEHLFTFKSSSVLCANSNETVNDYLDYTWVGAPWTRGEVDDFVGGSGGLSLRRVSAVREVLSFQKRLDDSEDEDRWLSKRIGLLPSANNANSDVEGRFSVESVWEEKPMGYVVPVQDLRPGTGNEVWNTKERRLEIYKHCPEIKMILPMQLERLRCPDPTPSNAFFDEVLEEEEKSSEAAAGEVDSTSDISTNKVEEGDDQAGGNEENGEGGRDEEGSATGTVDSTNSEDEETKGDSAKTNQDYDGNSAGTRYDRTSSKPSSSHSRRPASDLVAAAVKPKRPAER